MLAKIEMAAVLPILGIVAQHVDEVASLRRQRTHLVRSPNIRLHLLRRHDERMVAHLDGIAVAGVVGRELTSAALSQPGFGQVFTAAAVAIVDNDTAAIKHLLDLGHESREAARAFVSAMGWTSASDVRGVTKTLLASADVFARTLGIAACGMHQVDPGPALNPNTLLDECVPLALCGLDIATRLGRTDLLPACLSRLDERGPLRLFAARGALLLGNRNRALEALYAMATQAGEERDDAIELLLLVTDPSQAHNVLKTLAQNPLALRTLIRATGVSGQAQYLPWLLKQCADANHARVAAEAFCLITGLDLDGARLTAPRPDGEQCGPSEDAADEDVSLDDDDDLPWPDVAKLATWWQVNGMRFNATTRWFAGAPLTPAQCAAMLRHGQQRQRRLAALHRTLLRPGTPLFNIAAPAWRQQRLLAQMDA